MTTTKESASHIVVAKKHSVAKGHDITLKSLQERKGTIQIETISGETYIGRVINRDRWTITIESDNPRIPLLTIYKHSIESFGAVVL